MPRPKKIRTELQFRKAFYNDEGIECGRLTLNHLLVLNEQELFFTILRESNLGPAAPWANMTTLCIEFGLSGTWAYDAAVDTALRNLGALGAIEIEMIEDGRIRRARPIITAKKALDIIPPYTTHDEVIAGLEALSDE